LGCAAEERLASWQPNIYSYLPNPITAPSALLLRLLFNKAASLCTAHFSEDLDNY
jgi:hypothetical protein